MYVLTVVGNVFVNETSGNVFVNKTRGTTQRVASITTCVGAQHVQQKKTTKVSWERWRSSLARQSSLRRSRGAASRPRRRRMYTWISPQPAGASSATGAIISMARHQSSRPHTYVCKCMHGVCRTGCKLYTSRTCAVRIGVELRDFLVPGNERRKVDFRWVRGLD